ncbi:2-keto-4-pentenoate hydratase [Nocardioides kongjuensis]|uniref:2-keto-4-pentenoate hydratase n=1 Tax=Nocardioides kongjuensis TaxID=349522 RepID=A0A852R9N5_9ACTN|nr:2-keto-4-pentenoate hydratase [Nocardioides kongjuensis]NYD31633.1 2-keto-4-pentenoate hydratase [Nocardioides kongjuensis]
MNDDDITDAAWRLVDAARWGEPCEPVRDLIDTDDLAAAYRVQALVSRYREENGHRVVGHKVGLSSAPRLHLVGDSTSGIGTLFDDMAYGDREPISLDSLLQPRVGVGVAFVLGRDLDLERPTVADVIRATDFVLPAIEIVDSRIFGWDVTPAEAVADNASSGAFVLGSIPRPLAGVDLVGATTVLTEVGRDGDLAGAIAGNPIVAVTSLARALAARGVALRAGDVVLSGAVGQAVPVIGPGAFHARIAGLGELTATFVEREAA